MDVQSYTPETLFTGTFPRHTEPRRIASGQTLEARSVLGMVTATKQLKLSLAAATDGSQTPVAILLAAIDTTAAAADAPVYLAGCFNPELLVYGTGHDAASVKAAFTGSPLFLRAPL
ncbi:head decoration protein [Azospirillum doebereinerae]|uniref:head decoration protein n=1 Tax=Azospirillum doebereinerae TaxID=92933 RepID=UPI001EE57CA7|nr:head decoration protein [Azospirillum doebereinerae]MCG5240088.1 head decoration protein [Azospirillum doebereinerae]